MQPASACLFLLAASTRGEVLGDKGASARPRLMALRGGTTQVEAPTVPVTYVRTYAGRASAFDVFRALEDEGQRRTTESTGKLLSKSIAAGVCVGLGGTLCAGIGGDLGTPFWEAGQGAARFFFGAIGYPLSITLVAITGSSAFTGNLGLVGAAIRAGKCELLAAVRLLAITYAGCFIGTTLMGALVALAALPAAKPCIAISLHKLELTVLQTLLRGVGGGLLISLAITMATSAVRNEGGLFDIFAGIWLPIMTYVACDYEHCLANFFFFAAAQVSGGGLELSSMVRNIALSTAGNIIGAGLVGGWLLTWANGPDDSMEKTPEAQPDPTVKRGRWGR